MAVGVDGELFGSVGGGVMEVDLVEQSRSILSGKLRRPARSKRDSRDASLSERVHRKDVPNSSGMICS
jgi:xanthine/CO dehydrogenase XdhC/CoxF family maturation factor